MRSLIIYLVSCLFLFSCESNNSDPVINTNQEIMFEVNTVNFAWGYENNGYYIDKNGNCYSFDNGGRNPVWIPQNDSILTLSDLKAKYGTSPVFVKKISTDEIAKYMALVDKADKGTKTRPTNKCADAGTTQFIAYKYEDAQKTYKKVLLYQMGDMACKNLSKEASSITQWFCSTLNIKLNSCLPD